MDAGSPRAASQHAASSFAAYALRRRMKTALTYLEDCCIEPRLGTQLHVEQADFLSPRTTTLNELHHIAVDRRKSVPNRAEGEG